MMKVSLVDKLKGTSIKVTDEGFIPVVIIDRPLDLDDVVRVPFDDYFRNSGGSFAMNVAASISSPVEFSIKSSRTHDIFIKNISVKISDAGANLSRFGNLSALVNGIKLVYNTTETGDVLISKEAIKTNLNFIRLALQTAPIGGGVDAFLSDISGSGADTYLPVIDLSQTFGYPAHGLRIKKNSNSKISFIIQDNLSGLDSFDIIATGTQV